MAKDALTAQWYSQVCSFISLILFGNNFHTSEQCFFDQKLRPLFFYLLQPFFLSNQDFLKCSALDLPSVSHFQVPLRNRFRHVLQLQEFLQHLLLQPELHSSSLPKRQVRNFQTHLVIKVHPHSPSNQAHYPAFLKTTLCSSVHARDNIFQPRSVLDHHLQISIEPAALLEQFQKF